MKLREWFHSEPDAWGITDSDWDMPICICMYVAFIIFYFVLEVL